MGKRVRLRDGTLADVVWEAQPGPQTALLKCPVFEVFFGGARGGGKSDGVLGEWIAHSQQYGEHAIGLMIRRERTQLLETIERSRVIYGALGASYVEQEKMWRMPGGGRLRFGYLERDQDADAYQGHSYTRLYVEEAGTFPSPAPIDKLRATLRSGAGVPCGIRLTGNPGGPGHQWIKARYIDPAPVGWRVIPEEFKNPWTGERVIRDRVYIPSRVTDNRYLGSDYVANLQQLGSQTLVRAWLEGDWSVVEGAFFDNWSYARHVIRPFTIPDDWVCFRSFDWGFAAPFSVGWWAIALDNYDTGETIIPRGALVRYREWYGASKPNVGLRLTPQEVGRGIIDRERGDKISYGVADPSAFAESGGASVIYGLEQAECRGWRRGDNTRVPARGAEGGWQQVRARLEGDGERPMLFVFSTCRDLIRTLPAAQHDRNRAEDIDTEGEDHALDETRYACMSRPYNMRVLRKEREPYRPRKSTSDSWVTA